MRKGKNGPRGSSPRPILTPIHLSAWKDFCKLRLYGVLRSWREPNQDGRGYYTTPVLMSRAPYGYLRLLLIDHLLAGVRRFYGCVHHAHVVAPRSAYGRVQGVAVVDAQQVVAA